MSKIKATDKLNTECWEVIYDNLSPHYADLQIGFTEDKPIVEFTNLKFGFTLSKNGEVIEEKNYPPKNVKYIRTDQTYIINHRLKFLPDTEYELHLWAENANKRIECTETFTTSKPPQPYTSWTWDGEKWVSPKPYPTDGQDYEWDDQAGDWVLYQEELEQ